MPITIMTAKVTQQIPVTIQTPFYFKHVIDGDGPEDQCSVCLGRFTSNSVTTIQKNTLGGSAEYCVENTQVDNFQNYKNYLTNPKFASSEEEFGAAVQEMTDFLASYTGYPVAVGDKVQHKRYRRWQGEVLSIDTNMPHPTTCRVKWDEGTDESDTQWTDKLIRVS